MGGLLGIIPNLFGPSAAGAPAPLRPLVDVQPDTAGAVGGYHLGQLHFSDGQQAQSFIDGESRLYKSLDGDQRAMQLDTLRRVETDGIGAFEKPAPHTDRTIDDLLTPSAPVGKTGSQHFGSLTVRHDEVDEFKAAERALAARNPEARDTLAQLESQPDKTALLRGTNSKVNSGPNTPDAKLSWSPHELAVYNGGTASMRPSSALLHEETHAAIPFAQGEALHQIPDAKYQNMEERRVIEGAEARDLALLGKPARADHEGARLRASAVDSDAPELNVRGIDGAPSFAIQNGAFTARIQGLDKASDAVVLKQDGVPGELLLPRDQIEAATLSSGLGKTLSAAQRMHDAVTFAVNPSGVTITDGSVSLRSAKPPAN